MIEIIPETEVTTERLAAVFEAAFMNCTRNANGDLQIDDDAVKTIIELDTDRQCLAMFCLWGLKKNVPMEKKLVLVNELNRKLMLVKFQIVRPDTMWCDYHLCYDGELNPVQLIRTIGMFGKVCRAAVSQNDPEDIFGD